MTLQSITSLIPTMSAVALVSENIQVAKKKKKTTEDIMKLGITNIIGTNLIKTQAQLLSGL